MKVQKPPKSVNFPQIEKEILEKWEKEKTFQKSIDSRPTDKTFNFYDGPPFATGLPHFGHFVPGAIKDAFPRYFTMKGYRVERKFGWDCHGLPIEALVQKELNLSGPAEIREKGIAQFNDACRDSVLRYTQQWREYVKRLGRWVDMENEYRTMDKDYIESVWAVFKQLWDKGYVYEGKRILPYSPALASTLSNSEAGQDYKDIQDPSITVRAKLKGKHAGKSLLVWTTTPWTLPANVAVAIDPEGDYAEIEVNEGGEVVYLLESRVDAYFKDEKSYTKVRTFKGQELHKVSYEPFFQCFPEEHNDNSHRVYATDYVLHDTGTGAVHTAPSFGEDDFAAAEKYNLVCLDHLDASGTFIKGNPQEIVGLRFKEGDKKISQLLKEKGFMFKHDVMVHSYPMCYRTGQPLIYRAMPSWFVAVTKFKDTLLSEAEKINWVPDNLKKGRFGKWLENARDWNIARSRFWGNPIPIWQNEETGETLVISSAEELEKHAGHRIDDLHIDKIDHIEIPSPSGNGVLKRVPYVFDCWFESGAMPYAQLHYPFENKEKLEQSFPGDFICEGLDQTRCWFYYLHVLSTGTRGQVAFKNVVVNGIVLAEDGRKMSKSLKNYPDPMLTLDEYGADAVRLMLLNSPATVAEEVRFSVEGVKDVTRRVLLPLWNAFSFFATYASLAQFDPELDFPEQFSQDMDRWILIRLEELLGTVNQEMSAFKIAKVAPAITLFLDDLNNWYIRRNRRRFWEEDKEACAALHKVLVALTQLLAPIAPFSSDWFFEKLALTPELKEHGSVHLTYISETRALTAEEKELLFTVDVVRKAVELGRNIRKAHQIRNRQPLQKVTLGVVDTHTKNAIESLKDVVCDELNVKEIFVTTDPTSLAKIHVKPNFKVMGRAFGKRMKEMQQKIANFTPEQSQLAFEKKDVLVDGETLTPDMLLVDLKAAGDELVAVDAGIVASLDANISEELKREGYARDLVSYVQKARKGANLEVEDKITLKLSSCDNQDALEKVLAEHGSYIAGETLATLGNLDKNPAFAEEVKLEGLQVRLELVKA